MKKLFMIILAVAFLGGGTHGFCQEPVEPDVKQVFTKTMEIDNPELQLSYFCKVKDDKAYFSITSISSWGSEKIWSDLKLLEIMDIKDIIVYLNSPGGSAYQGLSISDEIRLAQSRGFHFTMEGRGAIMSAAVPIFLMGDKRVVSKTVIFLMHPAKVFKWGAFTEGLKELKSQAKMLELLENRYAELVSSRSNLSKERVIELNKVDTWFTVDQALEWGFVDEIK